MEITELTCINCPLGCQLKVSVDNGKVISVTGNTCQRGKKYAETEVISPKRTVTSTVKAGEKRVAVKTVPEIPKEMIFDVMKEIDKVYVERAKIGDVVIKNVLGTGADIVVTKTI